LRPPLGSVQTHEWGLIPESDKTNRPGFMQRAQCTHVSMVGLQLLIDWLRRGQGSREVLDG